MELWEDASARFHSLPDAVVFQPKLHRLRLRICTGAKDWTGGANLAFSGVLEDTEDIEAAGRYLLGLARYHLDRDELRDAMACQAACCVIWPECGMRPWAGVPEFTTATIPFILESIEATATVIEANRPAAMDAAQVVARLAAL